MAGLRYPPYHLQADNAVRGTLSLMASLLRRNPMKASYGVDDRWGRFSIRHGSLCVELPVIGNWPLRGLTPGDVADTLERLLEDVSKPSSHEEEMRAYAVETMCIAIATGQLDHKAIRHEDGGFNVELCFDENTHDPFLWIATRDPDNVEWERVRVDSELVEAGHVVPCRFFQSGTSDGEDRTIMAESCSETEGIVYESLTIDAGTFADVASRMDPTLDPVSILRMYAEATAMRPTATGMAA